MRVQPVIIAAAILVALNGHAIAQQPGRDAKRAVSGTASIAGVVTTDAPEPKPLRRVRVTLNTPEFDGGHTRITEDDGTFVLTNLPAGRYVLSASREGYVTNAYGASRPGRPGTPVAVADAETKRVVLRLPRGAVVSGMVQDVDGGPAVGVSVRAMRYGYFNGERQLMPAAMTAITDDRGVYRLYGLAAGEYSIGVSPRGSGMGTGEIQVTSAADMRGALDELREGTSMQARPGMAAGVQPSESPGNARLYGYAPVFFPGTNSIMEAGTLTLAAAEERTGIDFQVQLVPMARISGTLSVQEGPRPQATIVNLMPLGVPAGPAMTEGLRFAQVGGDGKFSFTGIQPGRYMIMTRATLKQDANAAMPLDSASAPTLWGLADVTVEGNDIDDLAITLQAGFTLSGRLAFEGTAPQPDPTKFRVNVSPIQGAGEMSLAVPATRVDERGQFTVYGMAPGRYRVTATLPNSPPDTQTWVLRSSVVNGRESLDTPVDIREATTSAVLTFSDKRSEITGLARDAAGEPAFGCYVVAATTERSLWTMQSRYVAAVRPSSDGKYTIKSLPPGEYFIGGVVDVEQGEWFEPRFLEQLAALGARVTVGEGERKALDVAVVR